MPLRQVLGPLGAAACENSRRHVVAANHRSPTRRKWTSSSTPFAPRGISIVHLARRRASLEDAFLQIVQGEPVANKRR